MIFNQPINITFFLEKDLQDFFFSISSEALPRSSMVVPLRVLINFDKPKMFTDNTVVPGSDDKGVGFPDYGVTV